jgi:8-oxo-dGTP diphosphatase
MDDAKLHIVAISGIVEKDKKALIVKRNDQEIAFPDKWTIPGGKLERGESIEATLKKEIREEVNLEIDKEIEFLSDFNFVRPDNYHVVGLCFVCKYKSGKVTLEKGLTEYKWVDRNDYRKYDLIPGVKRDLDKFFVDKA